MNTYDVGIITDSVQGSSIAFALSYEGYNVVLYNTYLENMQRSDINAYICEIQEKGILAATSVDMTVNLLGSPRIIFTVGKNGVFTEEILNELYDILQSADAVIDICDINYKTAASRCRKFADKGIGYVSAGSSGYENNSSAFSGISLMIGGSAGAYNTAYEMLSKISYKYDGYPCCAYMGPEGAGQYVKMIHDGIEYGMLRLYSEAISLLSRAAGCDRIEISEIISEWGNGDNESYLIQVIHDILNKKDSETGEYIFDNVSDRISFDKSLSWFCAGAAQLSVPVPTIRAAFETAVMLHSKTEYTSLSKTVAMTAEEAHIVNDAKKSFVEDIRNSLYISSICVYVQAFSLLRRAADVYIWGTDLLDAAITFQGGSFIRSRLLSRIIDALRKDEGIYSFFEDKYFTEAVARCLPSLRKVISISSDSRIIVPSMASSLSYIDLYASDDTEAGMIDLARDYIHGSGFRIKPDGNTKRHASWHSVKEEIKVEDHEPKV